MLTEEIIDQKIALALKEHEEQINRALSGLAKRLIHDEFPKAIAAYLKNKA